MLVQDLAILVDAWATQQHLWEALSAKMDWLYWCVPYVLEKIRASPMWIGPNPLTDAMEICMAVWDLTRAQRTAYAR